MSLDSRASVGSCGTTCGGNHGILNIRYADPCKKIYPSKDTQLQASYFKRIDITGHGSCPNKHSTRANLTEKTLTIVLFWSFFGESKLGKDF